MSFLLQGNLPILGIDPGSPAIERGGGSFKWFVSNDKDIVYSLFFTPLSGLAA